MERTFDSWMYTADEEVLEEELKGHTADEEVLEEFERFAAAQQYIERKYMLNAFAEARHEGLIEGLREEGVTHQMITATLWWDLPKAQQKARKIGRKQARELGRLFRQMASGLSNQMQRPASSVAGGKLRAELAMLGRH